MPSGNFVDIKSVTIGDKKITGVKDFSFETFPACSECKKQKTVFVEAVDEEKPGGETLLLCMDCFLAFCQGTANGCRKSNGAFTHITVSDVVVSIYGVDDSLSNSEGS